MTTSTVKRSAIIRCTHVLCPRFETFTYQTWDDRQARLDANAADPWSCGNHPQERRAA